MDWASENDIDTKKLKAAKIPIFGKWYHPDIPAGVVLVNLKTGELQKFGPGLRAGEILFVPRDELRRARLGPYAKVPETGTGSVADEAFAEPIEEPVGVTRPYTRSVIEPDIYDKPLGPDESIHLPSPSIFPLVLGLGLAVGLLGFVVHPIEAGLIVVLLGLVYGVVGGTGWAIENYRARVALEGSAEHGHPTAH
jgi:hypothetical protein